jgi:ribonuclease J
VIPGNDRLVNNVINALMMLGAEIFSEQDEDIHVSGHGSQEELKLLLSLTRPKFFIPVHGEYRHLKAHAKLAESMGIKPARILVARNGDIITLTAKSLTCEGKLELREMFVEGGNIYDMESGVIKERHALSTEGIIVATLVFVRGKLASGPDIITRGFVAPRDGAIHQSIQAYIDEHTEKLLYDGAPPREVESFLKKNLKGHVYRLIRMNPVIEIQVIEV